MVSEEVLREMEERMVKDTRWKSEVRGKGCERGEE